MSLPLEQGRTAKKISKNTEKTVLFEQILKQEGFQSEEDYRRKQQAFNAALFAKLTNSLRAVVPEDTTSWTESF